MSDRFLEKDSNKISIVVPCFNEEEAIPLFYREFVATIDKSFNDLADKPLFEVILVDDGSKDHSLSVMKRICEENRVSWLDMKYLSFSRNFGKEAAMYAGMKAASGNYVAVMDVDLQDPPSLLRSMYDDVASGEYDCVATRRSTREGEPRLRSWLSNKFYDIINRVSEVEIVNGARDFRLMSRKMVDAVLSMSEHHRFSKGLFCWVGFRVKWISYENVERSAGTTKWNFWKLLKYALEGFFGFSSFMLKVPLFFSGISVLCAFAALVAGLLLRSGLWLLAAGMSLLFGFLFLSIWFIGEYILRIHAESMNRPLFLVRETNVEKGDVYE